MKLKGQEIKRNDTVYLLGTSNTLSNTTWDRKDADYWATFSVDTQKEVIGHRIDAWFELHTIDTWKFYEDRLLKSCEDRPNTKIFMQEKSENIKNSIKYPLAEIQEMVNNVYLQKYFTSSIAFMVALAIFYGYKKIILYGISMAVEEEEYSLQKSCVEAWLCYALGRGIQFEIAQPASVMSSNYIYGYEPHKDVIIKLCQVKEGVNNAKLELEKKLEDIKRELYIQEGGLMMADHFIRMYGGKK